ncbi:hypothetical protein GOP47_0017036 [Adiantum capillus-veneris]|uniref:Uncharacterized protein n=1 Tax=Adiantum capillus-veneris TaxID=13818 RepID=A0A9D4UIU3_ADICA|nr:hypothetical protein GOP47_0017036 [Adiantum capillus-veneris]
MCRVAAFAASAAAAGRNHALPPVDSSKFCVLVSNMSHPALSLQKPLIIFVLLLIHLSLVTRAMRLYPTYAPPAAAWPHQQKQQVTGNHRGLQQHRPIATEGVVATANLMKALASHYRQMDKQSLDPPHKDCVSHSHHSARSSSSAPSPSSHDTIVDCSSSPAPEDAEGSEIDPRYGVEKRLVPTGPNPLHN